MPLARFPLEDGELVYSPLDRATHVLPPNAQSPDLVARGLFTNDDAIAARFAQGEDAPLPPVVDLVIPTRNRPAVLARAVRGHVDRARDRGNIVVTIVDDSDVEVEHANAEVLASIARTTDIEIRHVTREHRRAFVARVAGAARVPHDVVEYGTLREEGVACPGASRNAIMLALSGRRVVFADDDAVAAIAVTGDPRRLRVSSVPDPMTTEVLRDRELALREGTWSERSLLDVHGEILGRRAGALVRAAHRPGDDTFATASVDFLRALLDEPDASVITTVGGVVGDSGAGRSAFYWFLERTSLQTLFAHGEEAAAAIRSRVVRRGATATTLTDTPLFLAGNIGLDLRAVLPPFAPRYVNQDGVFGTVLRICHPAQPAAFLPFALAHDPPPRADGDVREAANVANRCNDLLLTALRACAIPRAVRTADERMEMLGAQLAAWGRAPRAMFEELVRIQTWRARAANAATLEATLRASPGAPAAWRSGGEALLRALRSADAPDPMAVVDLAADGDVQAHVAAYGELLRVWPRLVRVAREVAADCLRQR